MHKALFLDRDGVINHDIGYASQPQDIEFLEGFFPLCRYLQSKGFIIIVVTNQSGIARGYYSETTFQRLTHWITATCRQQGVVITHTYHCPHHPDITGPCQCRKPQPGMLLDAINTYRIEPENSIMIGDKASDMHAAQRAQIGERILLTNEITKPMDAATAIVNSHHALLTQFKKRDGYLD